ncbi:MAG: pyridoxamine 5'-phosphate oxidase family protein [Pseudolabrys sp.]
MIDFESSPVASIDGLRALYAQPNERVAKKPLDHVNEVGRAFIAASPFLVLATGSRQGLDCSPKGDHPGFVQVAEDGRTLFIPDRRGNNRIDGLKNLIEDPRIALIFFVPGVNETYRVNGRAQFRRMQTSSGALPSMAKSLRRLWSSRSRRHSNIVRRRLFGPTYGRRVAVDALKACRRLATSWQRAIREQTVPPLT